MSAASLAGLVADLTVGSLPLLVTAGASWDLWQPVPFRTTARGATVNMPLVWTSLLIGAIPRQGKTFVARLPLTAAAALAPRVRLIIADVKGGKDFRPFEQVAHHFIRASGRSTPAGDPRAKGVRGGRSRPVRPARRDG